MLSLLSINVKPSSCVIFCVVPVIVRYVLKLALISPLMQTKIFVCDDATAARDTVLVTSRAF